MLPGCRFCRVAAGLLPGLGGGYQVGDSVKQRQVLGVLSRECRVRQACPVLVGSNPGFERTFARIFAQILKI